MGIDWTSIVDNFSKSDTWKNMRARQKVKISRVDYETFCKEYIFNKLKGESFGNAFCKRFNITDRTISILKSENFAKQLIESLGYIE
jgi:hypothetical protein